jgi:hypothetical protein
MNLRDYKRIKVNYHPRMVVYSNGNYFLEHILKAEKALGRYLKEDEVVHHLDGNKRNNKNSNLVITDNITHSLLHFRLRAYKACGNPNYRQCRFCKKWDEVKNIYHTGRFYHNECQARYRRDMRANKKLITSGA